MKLRTMLHRGAATLLCVGLAGCDLPLIISGQPDYKLARGLAGIDLPAAGAPQSGTDKIVAACDSGAPSASDCYWRAKNAIDYQYQVYKTNLLHAVNNGTAFGDFLVLALNTAGAVTPGATAAKLFNALAAGATGTKNVISQDVLYKQTVTILISEMDSDRSTVAAKNEQQLQSSGTSVAMAVNSLLTYYEAGTFQHALVTLQNKAGTPAPSQTPPATVQATVTIPAPAPGGGPFTIDGASATAHLVASYSAVAADTASTIATHLAANANGQAAFANAGVTVQASGGAVTITSPQASGLIWTGKDDLGHAMSVGSVPPAGH
jgi:hypothetical protein